ncbi:MAG: 2-phosphosulfolactate phosphatase [Candidatus Hydrogenedentes bacterium]|nr:2-phosphosulfolactate phosphatase [Candidatus Hydrogenedentota bacterium]
MHIIEGEPGCAYAVQHGCVAIVVDALRACTTAAMLLHHGATEIVTVKEVEEARQAHATQPDALLYGERGGLPPAGFHYGNSPLEAHHAQGRPVIFTTTTGAGRMVSCWGAAALYMGSCVNAAAVARAARAHGRDVVIIPAGRMYFPDFDAQEDRVASVHIAIRVGLPIDEGEDLYAYWKPRIEREGLLRLFETSPHAESLRIINLEADIAFCAQEDITDCVPRGVERHPLGVIVRREV